VKGSRGRQLSASMNVDSDEEIRTRRKLKAQEDKDFTSARISESARYIGFGLAAVSMGLLTSDATFPKHLIGHYGGFIIVVSAFGCVTILLDYLHYVFGYLASEAAAANKDGNFVYLTKSSFYRCRRGFFVAKQIVALAGAVMFIIVLLTAIGT
jgi:hypothetical protein